MSFRFLSLLLTSCVTLAWGGSGVLRVCADPNNLPFSNQRAEGFENRLAELLARDLDERLEYVWFSQRRSFLRNTLGSGLCDAVMGVPSSLDAVATTRPYYRSTYVLLTRTDRALEVTSLEDKRFANWRVGVHMAGDGYTPPAIAFQGKGIDLVGYSLYGAYGEENPPAKLVAAVANGEIDVGIAWGPLAGYFSSRMRTPLTISAVTPQQINGTPFTYDISAAAAKGNDALRSRLDAALARNCSAIGSLLEQYHIPVLKMPKGESACDPRRLQPASWR